MMYRTTAWAAALAAAVSCAALWPAQPRAQDVPLPPPPGFEQGLDLTLGDWTFYNRLQLGLQATNNVRQDPTEESDYKAQLSAIAVAQSKWDRHALAFNASYARQEALETDNQESDALSGSVSGRIDIGKQSNVRFGLLHTESIIGKNDPQEFAGNLNGTTIEDTFEAAAEWNGDTAFARLETRYNRIENTTDINVTDLSRIQNQDRDEANVTLQVGRNYGWGKAYALGGPLRIRYTGSEVILPEDRDSEGVRVGVGVEYAAGKLQAIFRLIGFAQYYDADTIGHVMDAVGIAQASYALTDKLTVAGKLERSFDETNITGSAGLFTNLVAVGAQYQFRDDLYVKFGPSYRFYEIEGTSMKANEVQFDAALAWQVHKNVELLVNGIVYNQTVNDPYLAELSYDEAAVTVSTVITF